MGADIQHALQWTWMRSLKAQLTQEITGCGYRRNTHLVRTSSAPPCGCDAPLYCLDGLIDICGKCLSRWPLREPAGSAISTRSRAVSL
jgi:hypothetical protein